MNKVIITLTVDWEGEDFDGIKDLKELRKYIGTDIPITHFICPAYFTKRIAYSDEIIKENILAGDELALHVHCFKSLAEISRIDFRTEPDFFEPYSKKVSKFIKKLPGFLRTENSGRGVPLSAYEPDEIEKILKKSKEILQENLNSDNLISFRSGGWMASNEVFKALEKTNFAYDSSGAPPEILSQGYTENNKGNLIDDHEQNNGTWTDFILKLWGYEIQKEYFLQNSLSLANCSDKAITRKTQPYKINSVTEMPNNCGMSDYTSARQTMRPILEHAIEKIKKGENKPFFINIGCHQEGEFIYKRPIADFIKSISDEEREFIEFKNLKEAGGIAEKYLFL